ncbi:MAG TPA: heparan-alpha-glucosaminide N-acetyltransferase domain-containing protein, partial [Chryseosolibacter sp.]|nr:heparan-alpha-glucosaminide N-acetyltransferase domain-containing protein [Chryseosolibacter sp.]
MTTSTLSVEKHVENLKGTRIESIDLLRGIVMIIMALDHVRDYFHADAFLFNPLDLTRTSVPLYFTRWITHFCAPVFVFLAGTSAFLVGQRKGKSELSSFLLKRGLWLLVLEFTVINFSWFFNLRFSFFALTVIWALGIGMIALAAASRLPFKAILVLGVIMVAGHNLLDGVHVSGSGAPAVGWAVLHEAKAFTLGSIILYVGYPIIPWTGLMLLGYCFGTWYRREVPATERKKFLLATGSSLIIGFVVLRLINSYGELSAWSSQNNAVYTMLSFLNVTKYPPSLLYVLVTIGPA